MRDDLVRIWEAERKMKSSTSSMILGAVRFRVSAYEIEE